MLGECRLDLRQNDSLAAQFCGKVFASQVIQASVRGYSAKISGKIKPFIPSLSVRDEFCCGEFRLLPITQSEMAALYDDLPDRIDGGRIVIIINNQNFRSVSGKTGRHVYIIRIGIVVLDKPAGKGGGCCVSPAPCARKT